jgi:SAM-dependent methyltransferase
MSDKYTYKEYTSSESLYNRYSTYQKRYAKNIRESDKVLIRMIGEVAIRLGGGRLSLLDIGCSTGNLLYHIRNAFPELRLTGGDLMAKVIEECRANQRLQDIRFDVMDIFSLPTAQPFDIILANAVSVYFEPEEYERAIGSVSRALKKDAYYIAFEWLHPYPQELKITETSRSHPKGLTIFFRRYSQVEEIFRRQGFTDIQFTPFQIPVDLPKGYIFGDNADGFEDLNSYTLKTEAGARLLFRGTLFQPWCFLLARKSL